MFCLQDIFRTKTKCLALFIGLSACSKKEEIKPIEIHSIQKVNDSNYYTFRIEATNNNKPIRYIISKQDTTIKRGNNIYSVKETDLSNLPIGNLSYTDTILNRNLLQLSVFNKLISDTSSIEVSVYIDNVLAYSNKSSNPRFNK